MRSFVTVHQQRLADDLAVRPSLAGSFVCVYLSSDVVAHVYTPEEAEKIAAVFTEAARKLREIDPPAEAEEATDD